MTPGLRATISVDDAPNVAPFWWDPDKFDGADGRAQLLVAFTSSAVTFEAASSSALLAFFRACVAAVEPLVPAEAEVAG